MLTDKRVLALIERMGDKERRQFACDCAENVLHYFENMLPDDHRPRMAIDTARRFALDQTTVSELHMAKADAEMAAWNAAAVDDQSSPRFEAASSAAATAEMAASFPESAHKAARATVSTMIETVMVGAVGSEFADQLWSSENGWESVGEDIAFKARQVVEDQWEWQIRRGATYLE